MATISEIRTVVQAIEGNVGYKDIVKNSGSYPLYLALRTALFRAGEADVTKSAILEGGEVLDGVIPEMWESFGQALIGTDISQNMRIPR